MAQLATTYMGLTLPSPLVASAAPLTERMDNLRQLEAAGAGAIVLPSLFEEQLERESEDLNVALEQGTESSPEALGYFPDLRDYNLGTEGYLETIKRARAAISIPVIASINGSKRGTWSAFAKATEAAGADALELNTYHLAVDPTTTGESIEQETIDVVREVRESVSIPVAVKISQEVTSIPHFVTRLGEAGATAVVLFNRFYQPDIDLANLEIRSRVTLSSSAELPLRLRWVALLKEQVQPELAITGGIHSGEDLAKALLSGAQVGMVTSALLQNGLHYAGTILEQLQRVMEDHGYEDVDEMRGVLRQKRDRDLAALTRANYVRVLSSYS
ncbi:MAG: dihydroorotate dehydrogenase-like protein [Synergistales bacterium]|nr:dihydroorotate dehydrogenase-like protein [Synergistales bacterium]